MTWRAGLALGLAALAALGVAYWAQDFRGLVPCPLCLWERWPYRALVLLGLLAALSPRRAGRPLLTIAMIVALAGAAIAFLHVGVERHWWPSPLPECNGILIPGAPLPAVPAVPCDRPVFPLPWLPVSFATMDLGAELVFAVSLLIYLLQKPRRFR